MNFFSERNDTQKSDIRKRGNKDYYASINKIIKNIYSNCKGGCLVLFTAKYDMQEVYSKLKDDINTPIYLDNDTLTPNEIIEKFEESKGIILSAGSFWEGIDLKGKLLTNLIIVRLPFPVPDPVIKNKIKRLGSSDIVLGPEMIMKLKQGTGRLIRSKNDIGLVSILDSRMNERTNKYRDIIYKELPFKNYITQWEEAKKFQLDNEL
ncbi:MAG: helicase C-terminal domain-containing protein [Bavariicoccus seileri]|uniref:helicase C-terminal domain-containing protein n=1 Tax=Bavariicoccus seileri TaxID=549685 RepID=UPI003F9BA52F